MLKSIVIVNSRMKVQSNGGCPQNGEKMKNSNNIKKLTNIGPLIVILIFFALLGTLPFFSLISLSVGPVMVALIYHRGGRLYTGLSFVVVIALIAILINPLFASTMVSLIFIIGLGLIYMIDQNQSALMNFIVLALAILAGYLVMTFVDITLISNLSITEFLAMMVEQAKISMAEVAKAYEQSGGDVSNNPAILLFENLTVSRLMSFLPTIITIYALIAATIIYKVAYSIFKRMEIPLKPLPSISEIKANMVLVLVTLSIAMLGVILVYFGITEAEGIMLLGNNLFTLVGVVGGLSLLSYFMKNKLKYPTLFRVIILILVLASRLIPIIMIVGIIDSAFDFRTLRENGLYTMLKSKMNNIK